MSEQSKKAKVTTRDAAIAVTSCFVTAGVNWLLHSLGIF